MKLIITIIAFGTIFVQAQEILENTRVDSCVQCNSTDNNFDCVYPERLESLVAICETTTGSCFSRINDANGHIQRGCGSELRNETCDSELCQTCQLTGIGSAACNLDLFPQHRLSCYICDGDRNSSCANLDAANSTLHAQPCPIFRLEDSCFSTRAAGTVSRGCASSIPRGRCDHGVCGFCRGPNCNSGQFDSLNNALNIKIGFKLIAFVFAILAFNF